MTGRASVVCTACGGEFREWIVRRETETGRIDEGKCRDCGFFGRIWVSDGNDDVEIVMGADFR